MVNKDVLENSDVVFLAVKPHLIVQVVREIAPYVNPDRHLFVTVAAAMRTEVIEQVTNMLFSQIQYITHSIVVHFHRTQEKHGITN